MVAVDPTRNLLVVEKRAAFGWGPHPSLHSRATLVLVVLVFLGFDPAQTILIEMAREVTQGETAKGEMKEMGKDL